jgi:hypothetical protein
VSHSFSKYLLNKYIVPRILHYRNLFAQKKNIPKNELKDNVNNSMNTSKIKILNGQSHEKVCKIIIWEDSFGLNQGSLPVFKM